MLEPYRLFKRCKKITSTLSIGQQMLFTMMPVVLNTVHILLRNFVFLKKKYVVVISEIFDPV